MAGLNTIFGVEDYGVRVQAGVKLADLHDYLAKQVGKVPSGSYSFVQLNVIFSMV